MNENENENIDSINDETTEDTVINEDESEETSDEDESEEESDNELSTLQERLNQLEKENKTLKIQKAKIKEHKAPVSNESGLSQTDLYALVSNQVHEDDIDEVVAYAKLKNILVKEAIKSNVVKAILKEKSESRATANVANTTINRKAPQRVTTDILIDNIKKGKLPETDVDMQKAALKIMGIKED
jgi:hypothetical protein